MAGGLLACYVAVLVGRIESSEADDRLRVRAARGVEVVVGEQPHRAQVQVRIGVGRLDVACLGGGIRNGAGRDADADDESWKGRTAQGKLESDSASAG